jgi:hypothetical protein
MYRHFGTTPRATFRKLQNNLGGPKVYRRVISIYIGTVFIHMFRLLQRYSKPQLKKETEQIKVRW